jgi:hypothetical protein
MQPPPPESAPALPLMLDTRKSKPSLLELVDAPPLSPPRARFLSVRPLVKRTWVVPPPFLTYQWVVPPHQEVKAILR